MSEQDELLATVLRRGANAFAAYAANELLESPAAAQSGLGPQSHAPWKSWLAERLGELAAAVSARKPELFAQQVRWAGTLYAARDVPPEQVRQAVECLRSVLARELPESCRELAERYLTEALAALRETPADDPAKLSAETHADKLAVAYLLAVLEGDRQRAVSVILEAAAQGWKLTDLYAQVLAPAQREMGRMWLHNEINIADEHFATATTKAVMSQLRAGVADRPRNQKTVIAASVCGNQHDVGLQMVADLMEIDGWRTVPLGADVPVADLVQAIESYQADLLLLSAALSNQLTAVRDTIHAVRQADPDKRTKILVGGQAFTGVADLAEQYGADGYAADAFEALELSNRLLGLAGEQVSS